MRGKLEPKENVPVMIENGRVVKEEGSWSCCLCVCVCVNCVRMCVCMSEVCVCISELCACVCASVYE